MKILKKMSKKPASALILTLIVAVVFITQFASMGKVAAVVCGPQNAGLPGCDSSGQAVTSTASTTTLKAKNTVSSSAACEDTTTSTTLKKCVVQTPIVKEIQTIVNFLSAGVGIVVIIMIIVGGIQYSMAGDNPQALTAARQRITNALIALFAFMFTFAFLNWLIPGGIFG